jgi:16S rRNA (guanine527-N7)-methyltransferase
MSSLRARLSELVAIHALPEGAGRQLRALLDVVETDPQAPTTVTDPVAGVEAHIADALDGLRIDALRSATTIADLGAGAGFPGLALAVALPASQVSLLDSVNKKVAFMRRAADAAGLRNADPVHARAEEWQSGMGAQDVVTARALAPLTALVEYAAPLLVPGGHLVAWKGARDPLEEADGEAAAAATGLELVEIVEVPPRPGAAHRHLYVYSKVTETPSRYPRRAGMARKRPIQASS